MKILFAVIGPPRYWQLVVKQIRNYFNDYEYEILIGLWEKDQGGIKRKEIKTEEFSLKGNEKLIYFKRVKTNLKGYIKWSALPFSKQYTLHTKKDAIVSMFESFNRVAKYLENKDFTHVMRVRTDNYFYDRLDLKQSDFIFSKTISMYYFIKSDHLFFMPSRIFIKMFSIDQKQLIKELKLFSFHPEMYISCLFYFFTFKKIDNYFDYTIIYENYFNYECIQFKSLIKNMTVEEIYKKKIKKLKLVKNYESQAWKLALTIFYKTQFLIKNLIIRILRYV